MARIRISRSSEWTNMARNIGVYIDGRKVGELANGETREFEVTEGDHVVRASIDWCGSKNFPITATGQETKRLLLSSFAFSGTFLPAFLVAIVAIGIATLVFGVNYILFIFLPLIVALIYMITLGRNNYLVIKDA